MFTLFTKTSKTGKVYYKRVFSLNTAKGVNYPLRFVLLFSIFLFVGWTALYLITKSLPLVWAGVASGISIGVLLSSAKRFTFKVVDESNEDGHIKRHLRVTENFNLLRPSSWFAESFSHPISSTSLRVWREGNYYSLRHRMGMEARSICSTKREHKESFKKYSYDFIREVYAFDAESNHKNETNPGDADVTVSQ